MEIAQLATVLGLSCIRVELQQFTSLAFNYERLHVKLCCLKNHSIFPRLGWLLGAYWGWAFYLENLGGGCHHHSVPRLAHYDLYVA